MKTEKTPEEKRDAVLQFCKRIFEGKNPGYSVDIMPKVVLQAGYVGKHEGIIYFECVYMRVEGRLVAYLWAESQEWEVDLFYRILGLETADAVAEETAEIRKAIALKQSVIDQYEADLKAANAKSAKLVEALESVKSEATNLNIDSPTFRRLAFDISDEALEAHKKGATND